MLAIVSDTFIATLGRTAVIVAASAAIVRSCFVHSVKSHLIPFKLMWKYFETVNIRMIEFHRSPSTFTMISLHSLTYLSDFRSETLRQLPLRPAPVGRYSAPTPSVFLTPRVCHKRYRLCRAVACAAFRAGVRTGNCSRQPSLLRLAANLYPAIRWRPTAYFS